MEKSSNGDRGKERDRERQTKIPTLSKRNSAHGSEDSLKRNSQKKLAVSSKGRDTSDRKTTGSNHSNTQSVRRIPTPTTTTATTAAANNNSSNSANKSQNSNNSKALPTSAAILHVNALKLEESEIDIDIDVKELCRNAFQKQEQEQKQKIAAFLNPNHEVRTTQAEVIVHHHEMAELAKEENLVKRLNGSKGSSSSFSSSGTMSSQGDMSKYESSRPSPPLPRLGTEHVQINFTNTANITENYDRNNNSASGSNTNTTTNTSASSVESRRSISTNGNNNSNNNGENKKGISAQDLSTANSLVIDKMYEDENQNGKSNNLYSHNPTSRFGHQDSPCDETIFRQNNGERAEDEEGINIINKINNNSVIMSMMTKPSQISAPNTVYFLYNAEERNCAGRFSIYCKPTNAEDSIPTSFKIKLKSPISNFHFAAKPAIGFISPGEKKIIQVTAHNLPQFEDENDGENGIYRYGEDKYEARERNSQTKVTRRNYNIFANEMLALLTTSHIQDDSCKDLKGKWKELERVNPELISSHILNRLILVRENGDVHFKSCTHNIYQAISPSMSNFMEKKEERVVSDLGLGKKQIVSNKEEDDDGEDKTDLVLHYLKVVLSEIQDFQKVNNYTLTFQCVILMTCFLFMGISLFNCYSSKPENTKW